MGDYNGGFIFQFRGELQIGGQVYAVIGTRVEALIHDPHPFFVGYVTVNGILFVLTAHPIQPQIIAGDFAGDVEGGAFAGDVEGGAFAGDGGDGEGQEEEEEAQQDVIDDDFGEVIDA